MKNLKKHNLLFKRFVFLFSSIFVEDYPKVCSRVFAVTDEQLCWLTDSFFFFFFLSYLSSSFSCPCFKSTSRAWQHRCSVVSQ